MHIIIWGCGEYGQNLAKDILSGMSSRFTFVGFGDKKAEENGQYSCTILGNCYPVYNYRQVKEFYENREIDGAIIGVENIELAREIHVNLAWIGVPTYDADRIFKHVSVFDVGTYLESDVMVINDATIRFSHSIKTGVVRKEDRIVLELEPRFMIHGYYERVFNNNADLFTASELTVQVKEACFLAFSWTENYWHFVFEALPSIYKLESINYTGYYILRESYVTKGFARILGIEKKIIWISENVVSNNTFQVDKLLFVNSGCPQSKRAAIYVEKAVDRILADIQCSNTSKMPSRIFLNRRGRRRITGLEELLDQYGFVSLFPEDLQIEEQIQLFANAEYAMGPAGAALTNTIFMKPGSTVLSAWSSRWVNNCYIEVLNNKGINYYMVTSNSVPGTYASGDEDSFFVNPTLMEMTFRQLFK